MRDKKFFIYLRQSKKDNSFHTFDVQMKGVQNFAQSYGIKLDISETYCKREEASAYSGKRTIFEKMIEALEEDRLRNPENRRYGGIIFYNTSRIARNAKDFLRIEKLMEYGYKMFSATENIVDSPAGMYFFRMMQIESIYYSDRQSSKMQSYNLHRLFSNPYANLGGVGITYGYDAQKGNTVLHPVNSEIVKRIFELRLDRKTHDEIYATLQKEFANKVKEYNGDRFEPGANLEVLFEENRQSDDDIAEEVVDDDDFSIPEYMKSTSYIYQKKQERKQEIRSFSFPAFIPNPKKISDIVTDVGRIRYNGERRYKFELNFEEDARMQRDFAKSSQFPFRFESEGGFSKGGNVIIFNTPKLQIVPKEKYDRVVYGLIRRKSPKTSAHSYNGFLRCVCGSEITAKLEGGHIYYRCPNASKGGDCDRSTRISEVKIDEFVEKEILAYLRMNQEDEEFLKLLSECKRTFLLHLKFKLRTAEGNLTKFNTRISETQSSDMFEEYVEKRDRTEAEVEELFGEIEDLERVTERQLAEFFMFTDDFHTLDTGTKRLMIGFVFKSLELDEIREEDFIYNNPFNRLGKTKSLQYQKIVSSVKLVPYLHELFLLNRYHDGI